MTTAALDSRSGWTALTLGALAGLAACMAPRWALGLGAAAVALLLISIWIARAPSRWLKLFFVACLCLPPLPIALGNSGPHPALAFAALGLVAAVVRWRELRGPMPRSLMALPLYIFALVASLPFAAWFSGPELAMASLARVGLFAISALVPVYSLTMPHGEDDAKGTLRLVYWAGLISAVFALVDFYFQLPAPAGFGPQYIWIGNSIYRRAQGFFYESSTLGNVSAFFLVFIAASLARPRESPVRRSLLAVGAVLFMGSLLFSFSRGSLVGLIAALAAFGVAQGSRKLALRLGLLLGGLSAVSLVVLFVIAPDLLRFYAVRTVASVQLLISGNERALSGRAETWRVLTTYLANHPQYAVFGVGYKTLPYSDFIGQPTVADNGYLSALVETGMVGLAALLLLHFAVLRLAWKARGNLYGLWIFSFWCGEAVQMLSGDLFTYWRVLPLYFWTLAMAVRERQSRLP